MKEQSENDLATDVILASLAIHREFGPGMFENVYETLLTHKLREMDLWVERQVAIPLCYKGVIMDAAYKADIVVENKLIVEVKSVTALDDVHYKQVLTYLKISNYRLGLLINFNVSLIRKGIHRIVNKL